MSLAIYFVGPTADIEVAIEVQVFGTCQLNQAVLSTLIIFIAIRFVRVIILWNVFWDLACEGNAVWGLLRVHRGDDNGEKNWKISDDSALRHKISPPQIAQTSYLKQRSASCLWTLHFYLLIATNTASLKLSLSSRDEKTAKEREEGSCIHAKLFSCSTGSVSSKSFFTTFQRIGGLCNSLVSSYIHRCMRGYENICELLGAFKKLCDENNLWLNWQTPPEISKTAIHLFSIDLLLQHNVNKSPHADVHKCSDFCRNSILPDTPWARASISSTGSTCCSPSRGGDSSG